MQWENPPKIEWQTTLLQEKHRSCILWFSMQSLCWAKARAQPNRPSGAILAAFGRRQPPSGRLGLRPSLPANLPKGPPPPPADPCKPQALARRAAVLRTALAAGGRLRRRCAAPALRARFRHKLIPPASPAASAATAGPPAPLPAPPRSGKAPPPDWSAFLGGHPAQRAQSSSFCGTAAPQ